MKSRTFFAKAREAFQASLKATTKAAYTMRRVNRLYSVFVHDVMMSVLAFFISLQVVADIREFSASQIWRNLLVFFGCTVGVFLLTGFYRWMWRFISRRDTVMIFGISTVLAVLFSFLLTLMDQEVSIPQSFGAALWFSLVSCLLLPRFLFSFLKNYINEYQEFPLAAEKTPVLIIGTGEKAARFIREHCLGRCADYEALGLISHHGDFVGRKIHGISICGTPETIEDEIRLLKKQGKRVKKVLILENNFTEEDLNHIVKVLERFNLSLYVFSWQPGKLTKIVAAQKKEVALTCEQTFSDTA